MHRTATTRFLAAILTLLVSTAGAYASDFPYDRWGGYYQPYDGYQFRENFRLHREIDDMSDRMRRQQRQLDEQMRQQQEQNRLLQQQQTSRQQLTAQQACYYRRNGGLDVCDRLFDKAGEQHAGCVATVNEMNAACATDIRRPGK